MDKVNLAEKPLTDLRIQQAEPTDVPLILSLIKELAEAEKFPFEITATEEDLQESLFGKHPAAEVVILILREDVAGFADYYQTFATTTGRCGVHLDDLYVRPQFQGRGIGKRVMAHLAGLARERGCARFEWWALESNQDAIDFYKRVGAQLMDELRVFRLREEGIREVAESLAR